MRHLLAAAAILSVSLGLLGCARPQPPVRPESVSVIRSYSCESDVEDPQPAWNPATYQLVLRMERGFALYQEGRDRREVFLADDRRETGFPAWVNPGQFVFGPMVNAMRLADGRWVSSTDGLSIVTVTDNGFRCSVTRGQLATVGFRPRPVEDGVLAQNEDRVIRVDGGGQVRDVLPGFRAEPQPGGEGLCWQETPIPHDDPWTGKPPRGRLFVRWSPGQVTEVPGAIQARWTADGRVVATVLRADPPSSRRWWEAGTDVVLIDRDAPLRVIAEGCRDGAPHPREPLVAVTERPGGIRLVALDGAAPPRLLLPAGRTAQWSSDGLRLLAVEPPVKDGAKGSVVRVHVLRIARPAAP